MAEALTRESMTGHRSKPKKVTVDGYPTVYVKKLTRQEIIASEKGAEAKDKETGTEKHTALYHLAYATVDERGERVFTDGYEPQIEELEYCWYRELAKAFTELNFPDPSIQQIAIDAKN